MKRSRLVLVVIALYVLSAPRGVSAQTQIKSQTYTLACGSITWDHAVTDPADVAQLRLSIGSAQGIVAVAQVSELATPPCLSSANLSPTAPLHAGLIRTTAYFAFVTHTLSEGPLSYLPVPTGSGTSPYFIGCLYRGTQVPCRQISPPVFTLPLLATDRIDLYLPYQKSLPVAPISTLQYPLQTRGRVFYVTDRVPTSPSSPTFPEFFKNDRDVPSLPSGCTDVGDPLTGDGCYMSYGSISESNSIDSMSLLGIEKAVVAGGATKAVLFIHGFNNDFASALDAARELRSSLTNKNSPAESIPVIIFSWPTRAADFVGGINLLKYPDDETNNAWSALHLRDFLSSLLDADPALKIDIVAHSMGNRLMLGSTIALEDESFAQVAAGQAFAADPPETLSCVATPVPGNYCGRILQLIAIEPDVDTQTFAEQAERLSVFVTGITVYGSTNDLALKGSQTFHGHCRAGQLDCEKMFPATINSAGVNVVQVPPAINLIDTSNFPACDPRINHTYWNKSTTILRDISTLIETNDVMQPQTRRANLEFRNRGIWVPGAHGRAELPHYRFTSFEPGEECDRSHLKARPWP